MASSSRSILQGYAAAARAHRDLGIDSTIIDRGETRVDVFESANRLGVTVAFKPLRGLLGAYIADTGPGMLITTRRSHNVQRFTGAHELGHHCLKHETNLDDESCIENPNDEIEKQANSFASAFLLPSWLIKHLAHRRSLSRSDLCNPRNIYQLALRLGCSYTAMVRALVDVIKLNPKERLALFNVQLQSIKLQELQNQAERPGHADVWVIDERDDSMEIHAAPDDQFVLRLREHPAAGYRWDLSDIQRLGFNVVERKTPALELMNIGDVPYGAQQERVLFLSAPSDIRNIESHETIRELLQQYSVEVSMQERRGWARQLEPHARFHLAYRPTFQPDGLLVQQRIPQAQVQLRIS